MQFPVQSLLLLEGITSSGWCWLEAVQGVRVVNPMLVEQSCILLSRMWIVRSPASWLLASL